jgi:hypothetical protein
MARFTFLLKYGILIAAFFACNNSAKPTSQTQDTQQDPKNKNFLTMKIDGKDWVADREIFGSYHFSDALGPGLINISGVKGDAPNDQPFNINLYNTTGTGEYKISIADNSKSKMYDNVCQLAQLTPTNYLCGGAQQGGQFVVSITKASKSPQMVEASFSGTMQCVEGNKITITEGKFYYHEEND